MTTTKDMAAVERPQLPPGVRHYQTSGFAESQEVYDALSRADGWRVGHARASGGVWKEKQLEEGRLTVFPPLPDLVNALVGSSA